VIGHAHIAIFVLATAALALSPGPNMVYMLSRTISQGRRAGIISLLGVETGFFVHLFAASLGLTAFFATVPLAYEILRWVGSFYLLYLAFKTIRGGGIPITSQRKMIPDNRPGKLYRMGFLSNVLNPKTAVFYFTIFPQFIDLSYGGIFLQSVMLGAIHIAVSTTCNLAVICSASALFRWFERRPMWANVQRWIFGGLLAGFALRLAFEKRR
jgi:threonine/homoserine/homoserine lactone efflux protein